MTENSRTRTFETPNRPRAEAKLAATRIWVGTQDRVELVVGAHRAHLTIEETAKLAGLIDTALQGEEEHILVNTGRRTLRLGLDEAGTLALYLTASGPGTAEPDTPMEIDVTIDRGYVRVATDRHVPAPLPPGRRPTAHRRPAGRT